MPIFLLYIRKTILQWNLLLLVVSKTNMVTIYSFFFFFFYLAYVRVYTVFANLLLRSNPNEKEWSTKNVPNYGRKRDELPWPSFKQRLGILFQGAPSSRQTASVCMLLQDLPQMPCHTLPDRTHILWLNKVGIKADSFLLNVV